jgi:hypothetical protein
LEVFDLGNIGWSVLSEKTFNVIISPRLIIAVPLKIIKQKKYLWLQIFSGV